MTIAPERLRLALDQMDQDDGFEFERFANAFLASELPELRPVAGMHDSGRDAFVHSSEQAPNVCSAPLQSSHLVALLSPVLVRAQIT
jgi:hypothetical protein